MVRQTTIAALSRAAACRWQRSDEERGVNGAAKEGTR